MKIYIEIIGIRYAHPKPPTLISLIIFIRLRALYCCLLQLPHHIGGVETYGGKCLSDQHLYCPGLVFVKFSQVLLVLRTESSRT